MLKAAAAAVAGAAGAAVLPACSQAGEATSSSVASSASSNASSSASSSASRTKVYTETDFKVFDELSLKTFRLSTTGKNVVMIMLDRALNWIVPYLFHEKPELKEQFAGFTYYRNTTSFGVFTNVGTPPLYGGYDYTPRKMNARSSELLVNKHNEALRVMPVLFNNHGFKVTVCDPVYAGYCWVSDCNIFDAYPNIKALNTLEETTESLNVQTIASDGVRAEGLRPAFMNSYLALRDLRHMTEITTDNVNTFLSMSNSTTHDVALLSEPDYVPAQSVDNSDYEQTCDYERTDGDAGVFKIDCADSSAHYQCNMAALLALGEWFDYLRARGAYDNTRIIVVSDHGASFDQRTALKLEDGVDSRARMLDVEFPQALLLVKDFGATEFSVSDEFMTNADVPALECAGLIDSPTNPFTGSAIDMSGKADGVDVYASQDYDVSKNNGTTFMRGGVWLHVRDDVHDKANWTILDDERAERDWS